MAPASPTPKSNHQAHILRVRRTDEVPSGGPTHILLHISPDGSNPLDLNFVATEHEHLYHGSIKDTSSSLSPLQSSHFTGNLKEWREVLSSCLSLANAKTAPSNDQPTPSYDLTCTILKKTLTLTIRQHISTITRRLGQITLHQDDEREEVSFPEWVDLAVSHSDDLQTQLSTLQTSVEAQKSQVADLTRQLDDLVEAKKRHEGELLAKFVELLNAKKLKIRDLHRLLEGQGGGGGGTSDNGAKGKRREMKAAESDESDSGFEAVARPAGTKGKQQSKGKGKATSRTSDSAPSNRKRKAAEPEPILSDDNDNDNGDDGAATATEDEDDMQAHETPQHSDAEPDVEGEDEDDVAATSQLPSRNKTGKADNAHEDVDMDGSDVEEDARPVTRSSQSRPSPPKTRAAAAQVDADADDDDETDDEL